MKSSKLFAAAVLSFVAVAGRAANSIDMTDPRRALARDDDVRIDAVLVEDTVSSGSPVGVTYQVENLSSHSIAIADKVCDISYDIDSRTITLSFGSDVPKDGQMPHLTLIAPGQKKTLTGGAILHVAAASTTRSVFASIPQYVEIAVNVLREVAPFEQLIAEQDHAARALSLTDKQFDQWLESNDTILLNAIPVHYSAPRTNLGDASQGSSAGTY